MKIFAAAMNYTSPDAKGKGENLPVHEPVIFTKPDTALLRNGNPFFLPDFSEEIYFETEVVVKINRLGKNIEERFAHRYYDQVTVGIDFTAQDLLRRYRAEGLPWEMSKAFDASAVAGTFIPLAEAGRIDDLSFHLEINGTKVQEGTTADMVHSTDALIAYTSRFFTLKTGDLIYTGTPAGVAPVKRNDHLVAYLGERQLLDFFIC
ncbi:MAG: fumarylacetoacetate hydrolase family protein [Tannerellaceae bacterium]|jgi:2-keto-4-pentenoate hydratase/2-oxohepta-3-ene-1,7-dioic acid hydratase in catechol pathway|nr:fumarylacetoacetate hydrolase family protein [Tannerellaceae bacterium]